jgi:hypothetical protein
MFCAVPIIVLLVINDPFEVAGVGVLVFVPEAIAATRAFFKALPTTPARR